MRKFGMFFFALFALTVIFAGCANQEKEPKKTEKEATPSVSLLSQEAPVFSSDELFFPNTNEVTTTSSVLTTTSSAVTTTTALSAVTTTAPVTSSVPPAVTTTAPVTSSAPPAVTTTDSADENGGVELPDHNW